jgi:hypothetical protein
VRTHTNTHSHSHSMTAPILMLISIPGHALRTFLPKTVVFTSAASHVAGGGGGGGGHGVLRDPPELGDDHDELAVEPADEAARQPPGGGVQLHDVRDDAGGAASAAGVVGALEPLEDPAGLQQQAPADDGVAAAALGRRRGQQARGDLLGQRRHGDDERAVVHGLAALVDDEVPAPARGGGVAELEVDDAQVVAQLPDVRGLHQLVRLPLLHL